MTFAPFGNFGIIAFICFFDLIILYLIYLLNQKLEAKNTFLNDISEERILLEKMKEQVESKFIAFEEHSSKMMSRLQKVASEIEKEISSSGETIVNNLDSVMKEIASPFEEPLKEIALKQKSLDGFYKRIDDKMSAGMKLVDKLENLILFFNSKDSYQDILKSIETKKYDEVKNMLRQGIPIHDIADQLEMSLAEVKMVRNFSF